MRASGQDGVLMVVVEVVEQKVGRPGRQRYGDRRRLIASLTREKGIVIKADTACGRVGRCGKGGGKLMITYTI